ncbi:lipase family protein [Pseudomonas sp.]|uniref:lipase family protein n=1 Tax=Pseudomonas sp. TaxID=306 RepID=UPI003A973A33
MTDYRKVEMLNCPQRKSWVSLRLLDEFGNGESYAGLVYTLKDSAGKQYSGALDSDGYMKLEGLQAGLFAVGFAGKYKGTDDWYKLLSERIKFKIKISALQAAAEQTKLGPRSANQKTYLAEQRAAEESAKFYRIEVRDFTEHTGHLPDADSVWGPKPSVKVVQASNSATEKCVVLQPCQHHVFEVKALRAYSPLLSRDKGFCALNAYHLAVMTTFVYAPFSTEVDPYKSAPPPYKQQGSIGNVLREQLAALKKAQQFNDAGPYNLLYEEVPYSKRLEVMPYDPALYTEEAAEGWENPEDVHFLFERETESQALITHNDKVVLISVRGTASGADGLRDMDARQVPYAEGEGQAHRGFYNAFLAVKPFVERYLDAFYTGEQTIIVCGHSLGGAIALLLAEYIRRLPVAPDVLLYTFGSPRAGDQGFVTGASALTHHRLVNHNDPVPSLPTTWMDAEWKVALAGTVVLFSSPPVGAGLLLGGLINLEGDNYEHHGQQRHYMPRKPKGGSEASILWQPGCESIDQQACAEFAGRISLEGDMPKRGGFIRQAIGIFEHSSDTGYSRAGLTTLVRWYASATEREGALFTPQELKDLEPQIKQVEQQVNAWQANSFLSFKRATRNDMRFYRKTDLELLAMYNNGISEAKSLQAVQSKKLNQVRARLLAEAQRVVTLQSVFGEHAQRADMAGLMAEWRELKEIQEAERLAQVAPAASNAPRYA